MENKKILEMGNKKLQAAEAKLIQLKDLAKLKREAVEKAEIEAKKAESAVLTDESQVEAIKIKDLSEDNRGEYFSLFAKLFFKSTIYAGEELIHILFGHKLDISEKYLPLLKVVNPDERRRQMAAAAAEKRFESEENRKFNRQFFSKVQKKSC